MMYRLSCSIEISYIFTLFKENEWNPWKVQISTKCPTVQWYSLKNYSFPRKWLKMEKSQWNAVHLACFMENITFHQICHKKITFQSKSPPVQFLCLKWTDLSENLKNYNFLNQTNYRSVHFSEKIQILPYFFVPTYSQNLMKSWKLLDFQEKYTILKHFTRAFQWK